MPTYCYLTEDNEIVDRVYPRGEAPDFLVLEDGRQASRNFQAELSSSIISVRNGGAKKRPWPMACYASGVHASQADELRTHLRDRGCPTEVTSDGDPIYTSAAHRKKALKIRGMHDRNSFS